MQKECNMAKILSSENFDETVSSGVAVVDFWATWCSPCKMLAPIIEELSNDYDGKVTVGKVDVDDYPNIAQKFGVFSIPTVFIFKDGEIKERLVGFRAKSQLAEIIDKYL